jgi:hypothetical protein
LLHIREATRKCEKSSRSVRFGEPHQTQRKSATLWLTPHAEGNHPSACGVFAYISRHFAYPRVRAEISGLAEIIRGANVTLWVTLGPRTSRGKTLALSPRDSKRVNNTISTADRVRYERRGIRLTLFVISIPHRVFTDREKSIPACQRAGRQAKHAGATPTEMSHANAPTRRRPHGPTTLPTHRRSPRHRLATAPAPIHAPGRLEKSTRIICEWP